MKQTLNVLLSGFLLMADANAGETGIASSTPSPNKSAYTLFNPTPIELRRAYNTDRPSKTDSPYTIDAGVFQIETDVANWTLDRNNPDDSNIRVRTWLVAQTNFKLGLTNWMDFQIFPQGYANRRTSGSDFGTPLNQSGFGDTTIRLKINFVGNDGGKLAVGLVSSLKIPTNTDNLGNDASEPGFGLPVNYALPGGFSFFGQARIDIFDEPAANRRLQWSSPVGVSRTIAGKLSGYVEFYNAVSLNYDRPWIGTMDVGLIYQVAPNFSVDIDSFFGLTDSADDCNVFIGFARRF
jgi:Putative MetA-pathway of phenol degradation